MTRSWTVTLGLALILSSTLAWAQPSPADAPVDVALSPLRPGVSDTPVGREQVWSRWEMNLSAVELRVRQQAVPEAQKFLLDEERPDVEQALIARGVLTNPHDWPAGCSSFAEGLLLEMGKPQSPRSVEHWLNWLTVFRVQCHAEAGRYEPQWRQALGAQLDQMDGWSTATFSKAVPRQDALNTLLVEIQPALRTCLEQAQPEALRQGLDRHQGLRYMANQCRVSTEAVFGRAARCSECGPHPRRKMSRLTEALVAVPRGLSESQM